jgi:uncharacterized protein YbjT (DUF2867 family)
MILITGASGKTGRTILRALARRGETVRTLVQFAEQVEESLRLGAAESQVGDLYQEADLRQAMDGARAVYHICPNMNPDEEHLGALAIGAAQQAGVERLVYHSVLHPQIQEMPHHWAKLLVEERLFKSGLGFTILQPAAYMQNILAQWKAMVNEGVYAVPYAAETRLGMSDLEDVAEVAAKVLTEDGHLGAIYELAGAEAPTQTEVAELAGRVLGRAVRVERIPWDAWEQRARDGGLADYAVRTLLQMFAYYEQYGLWGNPRVLTGLLGRAPTTLEDFFRRTAKAS